ncbi:replication initiation protein [Hymenobacter lapidiphilus]|uniref:replication initiation protein n=1 Tax=Hymenobacter sp. CCM 8763 TaxID=2303334 RepID=UPI000E354155|nr:replication initiation protein [Hymenobacter sp. CCM 8763]RFP64701.1 replication initiation protein [Hymenobacter sp. CCM 8763]
MENKEVRQHNALTNARYEYTDTQSNIFLVLLSKLQKDAPDSVYQISVPDMEKATGKQYNYKQLRLSTKDMMGRVHEVKTIHKGRDVFRQLVLFKRIDYILGAGTIEVEFNEYATQYLFDLKNNYTSFQLQAALNLTSKHAKRIYQICSQWKDKGLTPGATILELKKTLGLANEKGKEEYADISMFKKKVLDISVRQINEKTDLQIDYELEKVGRSYKNIVFTIKSQALAQTIPFDFVATNESLAGVQQSHYDNAARILDELRITDAKHRQTILSSAAHVVEVNRYNHDLKTGKVKAARNPGGLLLVRLGLVAAKAPKSTPA